MKNIRITAKEVRQVVPTPPEFPDDYDVTLTEFLLDNQISPIARWVVLISPDVKFQLRDTPIEVVEESFYAWGEYNARQAKERFANQIAISAIGHGYPIFWYLAFSGEPIVIEKLNEKFSAKKRLPGVFSRDLAWSLEHSIIVANYLEEESVCLSLAELRCLLDALPTEDDIAIFPKGLPESQVSAIAALLDSFWITKILNIRECEDGTVRFQIS